jgi:hypothetical protein
MTNSQLHTASPPTPKQLKYLRDLAVARGQSFAYPASAAEASREIERLLGVGPTPRADRRRAARAISAEMAERRGDAARVRPSEIGGYGSDAHWKARA